MLTAIRKKTSKTDVRPAHWANASGTAFKNPWPSADPPTWTELASNKFPLEWANPSLRAHAKARDVKIVRPDWGKAQLKALGEREAEKDRCIVGTWLGHAGVLAEMPLEGSVGPAGLSKKKRLWMLFDPIFSMRAGPTQWTGPKRFRESPCQVDDLPGCDAVLISHNHYDHLDVSTIQSIAKTFPRARYFIPFGNRKWFIESGVPDELVYELDWWDDRDFYPEEFNEGLPDGATDETRIRFMCVPAQHNSGRAGIDLGSTLWCGWAVEQFVGVKTEKAEDPSTSKPTRKGAIYHAGDTGYRRSAQSEVVCPAFEEIGKKFGQFDLSFIPIWRGGTLGFISNLGLRLSHNDIPSTLHGSPTDAVAMHKDVRSLNTVGVHFGTFIGSVDESYEAIIEFNEACERNGVRVLEDLEEGDHGRAGTLDIGASLVVKIA